MYNRDVCFVDHFLCMWMFGGGHLQQGREVFAHIWGSSIVHPASPNHHKNVVLHWNFKTNDLDMLESTSHTKIFYMSFLLLIQKFILLEISTQGHSRPMQCT